MSIIKYFFRLQRLHQLIRLKSTGTPDELAEKLELSERHVRDCILEMKELGAPIAFCRKRKTYYYTKETHFDFGFRVLSTDDAQEIIGGERNYITLFL